MRRFLVSIVVSGVLAVSLGVLLNAEAKSTLVSANHHFERFHGLPGVVLPMRRSQKNSDDLNMTPKSRPLTAARTPTARVFFTRPYAMTSTAVFDAL